MEPIEVVDGKKLLRIMARLSADKGIQGTNNKREEFEERKDFVKEEALEESEDI